MNYIDAFDILEIDKNVKLNDITSDFLKKKYHKLALQYHPDKNGNTLESTIQFQNIYDAYNFLQREINIINNDYNNDNDNNNNIDPDVNINTDIYAEILSLFMKNIFNGSYNDIILSIVKELVIGCKKVSVKLFDNLDKDTTVHIYDFLSNNRSILHLSNELLDEIRELVVKKYDNVCVYKLNPTINDLLEHNVYKLYIDDKLFLVPLWHNEVYFDNSGCEIIVICEPELPLNVCIDDDNNIHMETIINSLELSNIIMNNIPVKCMVGKKVIEIPTAQLFMKREQYYRVKNKGLSKIKNDIYDITELSDLIIKITIV
jgi:curved DNA-binding protein CbpA